MPNEKPVPQKIPLEKIHDLPGIPTVAQADKSYGGLVASILLDGVKEPVILRQREDGEYQRRGIPACERLPPPQGH